MEEVDKNCEHAFKIDTLQYFTLKIYNEQRAEKKVMLGESLAAL